MTKYYAWQLEDGTETNFSMVDGAPDKVGAWKPLFVIEAATWEEAMAVYNIRRGFEPYKPDGEASDCRTCGAVCYLAGSGKCFRGHDGAAEPPAPDVEKSCRNCGNCAMDMDLDPYCAAVNKPFGLVLHRGKPSECGPENKLWEPDTRKVGRL